MIINKIQEGAVKMPSEQFFFCTQCGTRLANDNGNKIVVCPSCGNKNKFRDHSRQNDFQRGLLRPGEGHRENSQNIQTIQAQLYTTAYRNYRHLFDLFLENEFHISEYEQLIAQSKLRFKPLKSKKRGYYQVVSPSPWKYFLVMSEIYLGNLSEQNRQYLSNLSKRDLKRPSDALFNLISETYADVLDPRLHPGENWLKSYENEYYLFDEKDLVIGFAHDEFRNNGLGHDDLWFDNFKKQNSLINELLKRLETDFNKKLSIPVHIACYHVQ